MGCIYGSLRAGFEYRYRQDYEARRAADMEFSARGHPNIAALDKNGIPYNPTRSWQKQTGNQSSSASKQRRKS